MITTSPKRCQAEEAEEEGGDRQDTWLREMLSDTSGSEDEESCGRWISELLRMSGHLVTTSGGECSRQKMSDCP